MWFLYFPTRDPKMLGYKAAKAAIVAKAKKREAPIQTKTHSKESEV